MADLTLNDVETIEKALKKTTKPITEFNKQANKLEKDSLTYAKTLSKDSIDLGLELKTIHEDSKRLNSLVTTAINEKNWKTVNDNVERIHKQHEKFKTLFNAFEAKTNPLTNAQIPLPQAVKKLDLSGMAIYQDLNYQQMEKLITEKKASFPKGVGETGLKDKHRQDKQTRQAKGQSKSKQASSNDSPTTIIQSFSHGELRSTPQNLVVEQPSIMPSDVVAHTSASSGVNQPVIRQLSVDELIANTKALFLRGLDKSIENLEESFKPKSKINNQRQVDFITQQLIKPFKLIQVDYVASTESDEIKKLTTFHDNFKTLQDNVHAACQGQRELWHDIVQPFLMKIAGSFVWFAEQLKVVRSGYSNQFFKQPDTRATQEFTQLQANHLNSMSLKFNDMLNDLEKMDSIDKPSQGLSSQ